jgi:uncharacterized membrane protein YcaP (DUF421 family)
MALIEWYFQNGTDILRVIAVGVPLYFILVFLLRISGKRTLSKMNQFDFVITIAFGSVIATILLQKSIPLIEGITALALLIFLQFVVTWTSVRFSFVDKLIKSEPTLVFYQGEFLETTMKSVRVTESEIYSAMRGNGISNIKDVYQVIVETNGSLSVITQPEQDAIPPNVNIN